MNDLGTSAGSFSNPATASWAATNALVRLTAMAVLMSARGVDRVSFGAVALMKAALMVIRSLPIIGDGTLTIVDNHIWGTKLALDLREDRPDRGWITEIGFHS